MILDLKEEAHLTISVLGRVCSPRSLRTTNFALLVCFMVLILIRFLWISIQ